MFLLRGAGEIEMLINGPLILIKAMRPGGLGSERRGFEKNDEHSAVLARGGNLSRRPWQLNLHPDALDGDQGI
ncbi:MAG: hypothetical protein ACYDCX_10090 [Acidithiobacillus sp.]